MSALHLPPRGPSDRLLACGSCYGIDFALHQVPRGLGGTLAANRGPRWYTHSCCCETRNVRDWLLSSGLLFWRPDSCCIRHSAAASRDASHPLQSRSVRGARRHGLIDARKSTLRGRGSRAQSKQAGITNQLKRTSVISSASRLSFDGCLGSSAPGR